MVYSEENLDDLLPWAFRFYYWAEMYGVLSSYQVNGALFAFLRIQLKKLLPKHCFSFWTEWPDKNAKCCFPEIIRHRDNSGIYWLMILQRKFLWAIAPFREEYTRWVANRSSKDQVFSSKLLALTYSLADGDNSLFYCYFQDFCLRHSSSIFRPLANPGRSTRSTCQMYPYAVQLQKLWTSQFWRSFNPRMLRLWNQVPADFLSVYLCN